VAARACKAMKKTVKDWFNGLASDFYDAGIHKLVTRYNNFLNFHQDYVEEYLSSVVMTLNNLF
jgi:hypothetical protein